MSKENTAKETPKEQKPDILLYKHKICKTFIVGKFRFKNGLLSIKREDKAEWERAFNGLIGKDKHNIVRVLSMPQEAPVTVTRGVVTSDSPIAQTKADSIEDKGK